MQSSSSTRCRLFVLTMLISLPCGLPAQESVPDGALPAAGDTADPDRGPSAAASAPASSQGTPINFLTLLFQGGVFMIPILMFSLIGVTFAIERALALRRGRVLPKALIQGLGQLGSAPGGFDPKRAYKICQQYPSAAANVIRALLSKVGRPHSELEHTVHETSQREAERLYANVRWLNLAAAVTPLLGLLGTVWGMIVAFHDTTTLSPGQNKAEFLAEGIYIALVTTLGGLLVAIPAAIVSHYFEGRIQRLFHQLDELVFNLLPQLERFEGRVRFGRQTDGSDSPAPLEAGVPSPPVAERAAAGK